MSGRHAVSSGLTAAVLRTFWNALAFDGTGSCGTCRIGHGPRVVTAPVLAPRLAQTPAELSDPDLEGILDQVTSYLNGEGMPWHTVVSLGIQDGWPEHLTHSEETR